MTKIIYTITIVLLIQSCSEMETKWIRQIEIAGPGNYRINDVYAFKQGVTYITGVYWLGSPWESDKNSFCFTAKYNTEGEYEWHSLYERKDVKASEGKSIKAVKRKEYLEETFSGIFVHIQITDKNNSKNSVLLKYDSLGNIEWERKIKKSMSASENESKMLSDFADNLYIAGTRITRGNEDHVFIQKYDLSGKLVWSVKYHNPSHIYRNVKFSVLNGDQFVVGGVLENDLDFFFLKYDSLGNMQSFTRHETPEKETFLNDIKIDLEGNIFMTGTSDCDETGSDFLTIAYDKDDNLLWAERFDGPSHKDDFPEALCIDDSSNAYVVGSFQNKKNRSKLIALKYDRNGEQVWDMIFNSRPDDNVEPYILSPDYLPQSMHFKIHPLYIVGNIGHADDNDSDVFVLKANTKGFFSWFSRYKGQGELNRPTAYTKYCIGFESISDKRADAILVKYGKSEQLGVIRWD